MDYDEVTGEVIDSCITIHKELGPGLFETVYEVVLYKELQKKGLQVARQVSIPICYHDETFEEGFRADMVVEGKITKVHF